MKLLLIATLSLAAFGQDLPSNLAGAGLGFQKTGTPQTSGWAEMCHRNPDVNLLGMILPTYACAATDYTAGATSARVDLKTVLVHRYWFAGGTQTGGGAALSANGLGGSFSGGGWASADLSRWIKVDGAKLLASATWQKDDVTVAQSSGAAAQVLKALGARACFRFGIGKSW